MLYAHCRLAVFIHWMHILEYAHSLIQTYSFYFYVYFSPSLFSFRNLTWSSLLEMYKQDNSQDHICLDQLFSTFAISWHT